MLENLLADCVVVARAEGDRALREAAMVPEREGAVREAKRETLLPDLHRFEDAGKFELIEAHRRDKLEAPFPGVRFDAANVRRGRRVEELHQRVELLAELAAKRALRSTATRGLAATALPHRLARLGKTARATALALHLVELANERRFGRFAERDYR